LRGKSFRPSEEKLSPYVHQRWSARRQFRGSATVPLGKDPLRGFAARGEITVGGSTVGHVAVPFPPVHTAKPASVPESFQHRAVGTGLEIRVDGGFKAASPFPGFYRAATHRFIANFRKDHEAAGGQVHEFHLIGDPSGAGSQGRQIRRGVLAQREEGVDAQIIQGISDVNLVVVPPPFGRIGQRTVIDPGARGR